MSSRQSQLPPFRIRQLAPSPVRQPAPDVPTQSSSRPNGEQLNQAGIVRIRRHSYDSLLTRDPRAALTYLDDDDGEQVTVGSGFELAQRLSERLTPTSRPSILNEHPAPAMHIFDITDSQQARSAWQAYVAESTTAPVALSSTPSKSSSIVDATGKSGSLTPLGRQQVEQAAANLFRASRNSPPSTSPAAQADSSPHTTRWASYGSMVPTFSSSPKERETRSPTKDDERPPVPSKTQPAQKKPLLALFEAELAKFSAPQIPEVAKDMGNSASAEPIINFAPDATSSTTSSAAQTQPNYHSSQTQTPIRTTAVNPRDVIGNSFQALLDGINLLKTTTKDINDDLQHLARSAPKGVVDFIRTQIGSESELDVSKIFPPASSEIADDSRRRSVHIQKAKRLMEELQLFLDEGVASPEAASTEATPVESGSTQAGVARANNEVPTAASQTEPLVRALPNAVNTISDITADKTSDGPRCSDGCLYGCDKPSCAVKAAVKEAYERLFPAAPAESSKPAPFTVPQHFKVDKMLARRYISYDSLMGARKKQYLVRWVNRGADEDVWYDVESLVHCNGLVHDFDQKHPEPELAGFLPTPPLQSAVEKKSLAQLHARAADRMVTFQPPQAPEAETMPRQALPALAESEPTALSTAKAVKIESDKPKPIWAEPKKDLTHRRSWHPFSKPYNNDASFDFSPMDVMKKYPPVALLNTAPTPAPHPPAAPRIEKDLSMKEVKNVKFSALPSGMYEAPRASFSAVEEPALGKPSHEVDPSLYAPPSPLLTSSRRIVPPSAPVNDPMHGSSGVTVRRAQSMSFRPTGSMPVDDRSAPRRERYNPYAEYRPRVDASASASALRRANTTLTAYASRHPPHVHKVLPPRPTRSEDDTRRNNVAHCTFRLAEMGFGQKEAAIVSETVSGDLESALDILNEDGRAHDEFRRHRNKRRSWAGDLGAAYRMPGAFD